MFFFRNHLSSLHCAFVVAVGRRRRRVTLTIYCMHTDLHIYVGILVQEGAAAVLHIATRRSEGTSGPETLDN